jgi:hypothetical protein
MAYLVQTTATAANPTWTSSLLYNPVIATFESPSTSNASVSVPVLGATSGIPVPSIGILQWRFDIGLSL